MYLGAHQDCVLWRKTGVNQKPAVRYCAVKNAIYRIPARHWLSGHGYHLSLLMVIGAMENQLENCTGARAPARYYGLMALI